MTMTKHFAMHHVNNYYTVFPKNRTLKLLVITSR